jgi:hypothetical protein
LSAATHEEIVGIGLWRKKNISYTYEEIDLRILSVIRMVIVTRRDEQRGFVVFKYLSRRSNLVSIGTTRGSSTRELGVDPLRDGGSLHRLAQTGSGADTACHLMGTGSFPPVKATGV